MKISMRWLNLHWLVLATTTWFTEIDAQTWCGKNYMTTEPIVPPGGNFPIPATSKTPLLALRCSQAIRPYLPEDASGKASPVSILIDTPITFSQIANAAPITLSHTSSLSVTVSADGKVLAKGDVPLNASRHELPFSLSHLEPRAAAYNLSCVATLSKQTFEATGLLTYLPDPPSDIGSVTKMDLRTGALLARPANGKGGPFAPVFPIGFYTDFDGYLSQNLSIPAELKAQGFTVIHPVPTFANMTLFDLVVDKMQEEGLYLMYDMRFSYMDADQVTTQVNHIKSRPNLLLWYTGDEPDGTSDPLDATVKSSNLITSLDGGDGNGGAGYHPISLVLNCQDFHWTEYTSGTDIVMQDTYMIGNNVTFSSQWGTVCTPDYGDCGCDNCQGNFQDISNRMDEFRDRLFINGWERTKAVWTVPQGFGNDTYWTRFPTGMEFVVESIAGINHGGLGVISWEDLTTPDIKASASSLALALQTMAPSFILNPAASFRQILIDGVDVGIWQVDSEILLLASNTNYATANIGLADVLPDARGHVGVSQVFNSGSLIDPDQSHILFESVGSGGFVVKI